MENLSSFGVKREVEGAPDFLTMDELKERCSYAFEKAPTNPSVTNLYTHVNTEVVINDLAKLGWYPVDAQQRKSRGGKTIFSKHQIKFQNEDMYLERENGERSYIDIILVNSHDGFTTFRFLVGIFRLICSNGLVIADEQFENIKMRHIGYTFDELRNVITESIAKVNEHVGVMNSMVDRTLTQEEKNDLALTAMLTRLGVKPGSEEAKKFNYDEETIDEILEPKRDEDKGDDLWTVFNVIQEKMISGGFKVALEGKKERKVRKITSFEKDTRLNQDLFKLATSYLETA